MYIIHIYYFRRYVTLDRPHPLPCHKVSHPVDHLTPRALRNS